MTACQHDPACFPKRDDGCYPDGVVELAIRWAGIDDPVRMCRGSGRWRIAERVREHLERA